MGIIAQELKSNRPGRFQPAPLPVPHPDLMHLEILRKVRLTPLNYFFIHLLLAVAQEPFPPKL
jgi:hypothetical protein